MSKPLHRCINQFLALSGYGPLDEASSGDLLAALEAQCETREVLIAEGAGEYLRSNLENNKNYPFLLLAKLSDSMVLPAVLRYDFLNDAFEAWLFHSQAAKDEHFEGKMAENLLAKPLVKWESLHRDNADGVFALVPSVLLEAEKSYPEAPVYAPIVEEAPENAYTPSEAETPAPQKKQPMLEGAQPEIFAEPLQKDELTASIAVAVAGANASFSAQYDESLEVKDFIWRFGDGGQSKTRMPQTAHEYPQPGTYTAMLDLVLADGTKIRTSTAVEIKAKKKPQMDMKTFLKPILGGIALVVLAIFAWQFFSGLANVQGINCEDMPPYLRGTYSGKPVKFKLSAPSKLLEAGTWQYDCAQLGKGPGWQRLTLRVSFETKAVSLDKYGEGTISMDPITCQWNIAIDTENGALQLKGLQTE